MRPGNTLRPFRLIRRVPEAATGRTSSSRATAVNLPSVIATALAVGLERSNVVNRPWYKMRSGAVVDWFMNAPLETGSWVASVCPESRRIRLFWVLERPWNHIIERAVGREWRPPWGLVRLVRHRLLLERD